MRYPNIAAEVAAQRCKAGFGFDTLALCARVTRELLHDIVWGDEPLTAAEAIDLHRALTPLGSYEGFSLGYLLSPRPAVVLPGTNKGKQRLFTLRRLIGEAERVTPAHWYQEPREHARHTLELMEAGEAVPYADYRAAMVLAKRMLADDAASNAKRRRRGKQETPT